MNSLSIRIILINQHFLFFSNVYIPSISTFYIRQGSRKQMKRKKQKVTEYI